MNKMSSIHTLEYHFTIKGMRSPMLQHGWALRYGKATYYTVILVQNDYYKLIHRGRKQE